MQLAAQRLAENLSRIRGHIAAAAHRAGRQPEHIKLVAITKYVDSDLAAALVDAGCGDLGESRPQELWKKNDAMRRPDVTWHLVGHLQRNKVRRTLPMVSWIHSVDSVSLLETIDAQSAAMRIDPPLQVLLEVNISGDTAKHGFAPHEMPGVVANASKCRHLQIRGLMAMASLEGDLDAARRDFRHLRELRDQLRPLCPENVQLEELSMGMSGDYEVAIEEGATIIRVGSACFEGIQP